MRVSLKKADTSLMLKQGSQPYQFREAKKALGRLKMTKTISTAAATTAAKIISTAALKIDKCIGLSEKACRYFAIKMVKSAI